MGSNTTFQEDTTVLTMVQEQSEHIQKLEPMDNRKQGSWSLETVGTVQFPPSHPFLYLRIDLFVQKHF